MWKPPLNRLILCGGGLVVALLVLIVSSERAAGVPAEDHSFCRHRVKIAHNRLAVRLRTDSTVYAPGDQAVFRIDNVGTVAIALVGEPFSVERNDGSGWVKDPASPDRFTRIRLGFLKPGRSGFCRSFQIPSDMASGHYRFSKYVNAGPRHKALRLTAPFDLIG